MFIRLPALANAPYGQFAVIGCIRDEEDIEVQGAYGRSRPGESVGRLAAGELRLDQRVIQTISKNNSIEPHDPWSRLGSGSRKREAGDRP